MFGSLHPLTPPNRPHNSLYVISPDGGVVTRYDKRFLSGTEVTWMYEALDVDCAHHLPTGTQEGSFGT